LERRPNRSIFEVEVVDVHDDGEDDFLGGLVLFVFFGEGATERARRPDVQKPSAAAPSPCDSLSLSFGFSHTSKTHGLFEKKEQAVFLCLSAALSHSPQSNHGTMEGEGGATAPPLEVVAAIDQGTQSTRVYLFDRDARPVAWHQVPLPQIYPQAGCVRRAANAAAAATRARNRRRQRSISLLHPRAKPNQTNNSWCEHDPEEIWRSVVECLARALENAERKLQADNAATAATTAPPPPTVRIRAIGLTNQRETALVWDRATGKALHPAIVWHDLRTSAICEDWEARLPGGRDHFRPVCGLPVSTYFSAPKWVWMRDHSAQVRDALTNNTACLGTVDSWLIFRLTGGSKHVTDVTNAARTMLLDLRTRDWHPATLELLGIPRNALPEVKSNSEEYGRVDTSSKFFGDGMFAFAAAATAKDESADPSTCAAAAVALAEQTRAAYANVPVAGSLGDQMAALLGQRCGPGEAKNTYGTGCFMLLNTGPGRPAPSAHGLLTTVGFQLGPQAAPHYALEGSVAVAGRGVSWLKDNLGLISSADESEDLAASVQDTGGVYFVPAFSGLLAPRWDDTARGALLGLTGHTTRAHVVRAMLEAVCFQTREVLEAMRADVLDAAGTATGAAAAGGGGSGGGGGGSGGGGSGGALGIAASRGASSSSFGRLQQQQQQQEAGGEGAAAAAGPAARLSVLRVDGGAATNALLMQLQADLLQVAVERPAFLETTAMGAALAAGLATGFYARGLVEPWAVGEGRRGEAEEGARVFLPSVSEDEAARRYAHWNKAVSRSVGLADLAT
jgi:glycerol kinase